MQERKSTRGLQNLQPIEQGRGECHRRREPTSNDFASAVRLEVLKRLRAGATAVATPGLEGTRSSLGFVGRPNRKGARPLAVDGLGPIQEGCRCEPEH